MLSSHLCLGLPNYFISSGIANNIFIYGVISESFTSINRSVYQTLHYTIPVKKSLLTHLLMFPFKVFQSIHITAQIKFCTMFHISLLFGYVSQNWSWKIFQKIKSFLKETYLASTSVPLKLAIGLNIILTKKTLPRWLSSGTLRWSVSPW